MLNAVFPNLEKIEKSPSAIGTRLVHHHGRTISTVPIASSILWNGTLSYSPERWRKAAPTDVNLEKPVKCRAKHASSDYWVDGKLVGVVGPTDTVAPNNQTTWCVSLDSNSFNTWLRDCEVLDTTQK